VITASRPLLALCQIALAIAAPLQQPARATSLSANAAAVIREGVAVRSGGEQTLPAKRNDKQLLRTIQTVTRPCTPAEPSILCTLVLVEMQ
jgi:hypothetical protein